MRSAPRGRPDRPGRGRVLGEVSSEPSRADGFIARRVRPVPALTGRILPACGRCNPHKGSEASANGQLEQRFLQRRAQSAPGAPPEGKGKSRQEGNRHGEIAGLVAHRGFREGEGVHRIIGRQ